MQYASALPDLVKDNIGDAPLTVGLLLKKLGLVYSEYFLRYGHQHYRGLSRRRQASPIRNLLGNPSMN